MTPVQRGGQALATELGEEFDPEHDDLARAVLRAAVLGEELALVLATAQDTLATTGPHSPAEERRYLAHTVRSHLLGAG